MRWIIFIAIYVAFGLAFGVVLDQPIHSVSGGYFWAWLLAWPLIIAFSMLKWILIVMAAIIGLIVCFVFIVAWFDPRQNRPR